MALQLVSCWALSTLKPNANSKKLEIQKCPLRQDRSTPVRMEDDVVFPSSQNSWPANSTRRSFIKTSAFACGSWRRGRRGRGSLRLSSSDSGLRRGRKLRGGSSARHRKPQFEFGERKCPIRIALHRRNGRHARSFVTRSRKLNLGGVGGQNGRTRSPVTCAPACECGTKRGTLPARIEDGLVHAQAAFNLDAQEIIGCDSHGI